MTRNRNDVREQRHALAHEMNNLKELQWFDGRDLLGQNERLEHNKYNSGAFSNRVIYHQNSAVSYNFIVGFDLLALNKYLRYAV